MSKNTLGLDILIVLLIVVAETDEECISDREAKLMPSAQVENSFVPIVTVAIYYGLTRRKINNILLDSLIEYGYFM